MKNKIVKTNNAPQAIGPYSQAVISGGFLFSAGQIPLDPHTMKLVEGGIEEQTKRVLDNLKGILTAEKLDFSSVIKTTIYLIDLNHFKTVNTIYTEHFGENKPARSTIQVAKLPMDALIEIEIIASI
ncbi:MAG: RidA family protein [Spirochaetota bacterium]|nr:RidA family protein [Spirochaetota bacterium]